MYEFSKEILIKVSFDKFLFRKELTKAIRCIKEEEIPLLKEWCIATFANYRELITEAFQSTSLPSHAVYAK